LDSRKSEPFWAFRPLPNGDQGPFINRVINDPDAFITALLGGNRSGKSTAGAYCFAYRALFVLPRKRPKMTRLSLVIAPKFELCGEVAWKQKLRQFIHPRNIADIAWYSKVEEWPTMIRLTNGNEIRFKAWAQGRDAFEGLAVDDVWADEQFPSDAFLELITRLVDRDGRVWTTLTPIEPDPYLREMHDDPPRGWTFFRQSIDDNRKSRGGHLGDAEVDQIIASWPQEVQAVRRAGEFAGFEGLIYPSFRASTHIAADAPGDELFRRIGPNWLRYVTIDFGWANPSAWLFCARDADDRWIVYDEIYEMGWTLERLTELAEKKIREHAAAVGAPGPISRWYGDSADVVPISQPEWASRARLYMAARGISLTTPRKDVLSGIESVRKAMMTRGTVEGDSGLIISKCRCPNLIRELGSYRFRKESPLQSAKEAPLKKADHACDALRYLVHSEAERPSIKGDTWMSGSPFKTR
jgi:phage terminase large subunit-like protein